MKVESEKKKKDEFFEGQKIPETTYVLFVFCWRRSLVFVVVDDVVYGLSFVDVV